MFSGEATAVSGQVRDRLSLALLIVGMIAIVGVGAAQLAKDGSLWRDEASVAVSLLKLSPLELFGRLEGGQSFPRLYLFAIAGLKAVLGYHTLVLRALPFLFFVFGSCGWVWLLHRRFRNEPAMLAAGILLALIPATWFVQAAMFKPYTFDVFAAMIPFLLNDRFYASALERGERSWRLLGLTVLCALSYPFALVLVARLAGWWVMRRGRRRIAIDPRAGWTLFGSIALFGGCLWLTDLRHTSELSESLSLFWKSCVLGGPEEPADLVILDRFAFGWYTGGSNFSRGGGLPDLVAHALRLGFAAGVVRIGLSMFRSSGSDPSLPRDWGSRSLGHAALLCGVVVAALVASYPICPGRLTLFALLPLQIVTLEGFSWGAGSVIKLPGGHVISVLLGLALVGAVAPTSARDAAGLIRSAAPDDLRAGLDRMWERPHLPMITTTCTTKQIETLPEGIDRPVLFAGPRQDLSDAFAAGEAWILHSPAPYCANQIRSLRGAASSWTETYRKPFASRLIHAEFRR